MGGLKKSRGALALPGTLIPAPMTITYLDLFTHKSLTFVAHGTAI